MAYLALYRKYRPQTFEGLIGQDHIVKTLVNQIESGRLGHAYLFTGTRGTGKTSAAKIFAKAINCEHPKNGSPCGECEACRALSDPSNIDVIEIDAASNNGVNEIRELRENVQYPPVSCKYKVYIIDEVHMLSGAAFNALLKTLEEPPKHAVFILATTEAYKIPATILSRCMRFDFRLIPTERIAELIGKIYDEQGKEYEKEAVYLIAKAGEGSIRDALSVADIAISYGSGKLTYKDVTEILGATDGSMLLDLIGNMLNGNAGEVLKSIDNLTKLGKSMGVLAKDITSSLRDILVVKTCENANGILNLPENRYNEYKKIADTVESERLIRSIEIFAEAESSLKYTVHPRVILETAAVKATRPQSDYNMDALLARIKEVESKIESGVSVKTVIKNADINVEHVEPVVPEKAEEPVKKSALISDGVEIKGKLLSGLRKIGSEMLWNIMQNVEVKALGGVLVLTPKNSGDYEILIKVDNQEKIKDGLSEYQFEITVVEPKDEKIKDEMESATDKIKSIFGEDIVIIKH